MPEEKAGRVNYFEANGFKTGRIMVPGLDFMVNLKPGRQFFRYDGPIISLPHYIATLPKVFKDNLSGSNLGHAGAFNCGYILDAGTRRSQTGFLMVVLNVSPRVNVTNEAHEAAEILINFGLKPELDKLFKKHGVNLDLSRLNPHHIGLIAGYIAAMKIGFDIGEFYRGQDPEGYLALKTLGLF